MIVSQNDYGCKADDSDGESKADDSDGESKNRPVATNFQFLKFPAPLGLLLVGGVPAPNPILVPYGLLLIETMAGYMFIRTLMQSSSAFRKEPFPQSLSS